jgi:hypothetical protein
VTINLPSVFRLWLAVRIPIATRLPAVQALTIGPENVVPDLVDLHLFEFFPTGHPSPKRLVHQGKQVDDPFVAIIKHEPHDSEANRLDFSKQRYPAAPGRVGLMIIGPRPNESSNSTVG